MHSKDQILTDLLSSKERFIKRNTSLISLSRRFSYYRLGIFLTGVILVLLSFFFISTLLSWIVLAATLVVFGITANIHNKINKGIKKNSFWVSIKERKIARILIDWDKIPQSEFLIPDEKHPFDADLNITGKYSLHRLLDNSVSLDGSRLLKQWLLTEIPDIQQITLRQKLIKEIRSLNKFRDKLVLNALFVSPEKHDSSKFILWLSTDNNIHKLTGLLTLSWTILSITLLLFLLFLFTGLPPLFSVGLLVYSAFYFFNMNLLRDSFEKAIHIEAELGKYFSILSFLEKYPYGMNSNLKDFCSPLIDVKTKPQKHFRVIKNLINALSFQKNPLTALLLNLLMPWDIFFTLKLNKEKQLLSENLHQWFTTLHNLEALNSIAEFSYLNPEYNFPDFNDNLETIILAENMGHPLIPNKINIKNDFEISRLGEVDIITGSNMSGKSTFLKTIGCNLTLAFCGAPVNALKFRTGLFRLFTCIKIDDSVTDGISYFYAEVRRLKQLLDQLKSNHPLPLFFLIDEIFKGTNNRERLIGSQAYIKALAKQNGAGLISTHDLELVKLESEVKSIKNYHFSEEAVDGKLIFDYKIKSGPSPTTNALKIMEIEGLPVV